MTTPAKPAARAIRNLRHLVPALPYVRSAAADVYAYATAAPMLETSTGHPIAVLPKNGMTTDTAITNNIAFRGVPSGETAPSRLGSMSATDMACMSLLSATSAAMMPVICPAIIIVLMKATPAPPKRRRADAKTGTRSMLSSRALSSRYTFHDAAPSGSERTGSNASSRYASVETTTATTRTTIERRSGNLNSPDRFDMASNPTYAHGIIASIRVTWRIGWTSSLKAGAMDSIPPECLKRAARKNSSIPPPSIDAKSVWTHAASTFL